MKILKLQVKGLETIGNCIKVDNSVAYQDTITKNQVYNNVIGKTIKINNICNQAFTVPAKTIFSQQDGFGSTFVAGINSTVIPANAEVNVPVYYNGVYKNTNLAPSYPFTINGTNLLYNLIIIVPDALGTLGSFTITRNNRQDYTFLITDFTSKFSDPDGDTIATVMLYGNVSNIRLNGVAYVANTEVPLVDIQLGKLSFTAPAQDAYSSIDIDYKIKDTKGNIII